MFNSYSEDLTSFPFVEAYGRQTKSKSKVLKQIWENKKLKEIFENKEPTLSPEFLRFLQIRVQVLNKSERQS